MNSSLNIFYVPFTISLLLLLGFQLHCLISSHRLLVIFFFSFVFLLCFHMFYPYAFELFFSLSCRMWYLFQFSVFHFRYSIFISRNLFGSFYIFYFSHHHVLFFIIFLKIWNISIMLLILSIISCSVFIGWIFILAMVHIFQLHWMLGNFGSDAEYCEYSIVEVVFSHISLKRIGFYSVGQLN